GVVLPLLPAALAAAPAVSAISAVFAVSTVDRLVPVDVHVVVVPAATAAATAVVVVGDVVVAPVAAATPNRRADRHADAERHQAVARRIHHRRVVGLGRRRVRRSVYLLRAVLRHVDDLRIRRLDDDRL